MSIRSSLLGACLLLPAVAALTASTTVERVRNDKVVVLEQSLAPGETEARSDLPSVVVYLDAGSVELTSDGQRRHDDVERGQAVFCPAHSGTLRNAGTASLRIVRIEYQGGGSDETWGAAGLAPHYRLLFENRYGRVYDIRIAAGTSEPLHSHHDRVVVCLSGAELMHEMPDGRREPSTLETGDIAWRRGGTHVGHNVGRTDLWVIAVEPK
jgi:quercetin dioxygenase-like cupin family protein